jgi:hypothetical protein
LKPQLHKQNPPARVKTLAVLVVSEGGLGFYSLHFIQLAQFASSFSIPQQDKFT